MEFHYNHLHFLHVLHVPYLLLLCLLCFLHVLHVLLSVPIHNLLYSICHRNQQIQVQNQNQPFFSIDEDHYVLNPLCII